MGTGGLLLFALEHVDGSCPQEKGGAGRAGAEGATFTLPHLAAANHDGARGLAVQQQRKVHLALELHLVRDVERVDRLALGPSLWKQGEEAGGGPGRQGVGDGRPKNSTSERQHVVCSFRWLSLQQPSQC